MSWQFVVVFLMSAFPAVAWIFGQVMEQKLEKKGFQEVKEEEQSFKSSLLIFISGLCYLTGMELIALGIFLYTSMAIVGGVIFTLGIILSYKVKVFDTLLKG